MKVKVKRGCGGEAKVGIKCNLFNEDDNRSVQRLTK